MRNFRSHLSINSFGLLINWDAKIIQYFKEEIAGLRTGRATPALVDKISVEVYGVKTPLLQLASITTPDPRTILIEPWDKNIVNLYNFIRGLSPYPAAFSEFISPEGDNYSFKIFKASIAPDSGMRFENAISTDGKNYLHIKANGGLIYINEIQISGKKRMNIEDFLRGFSINSEWKLK